MNDSLTSKPRLRGLLAITLLLAAFTSDLSRLHARPVGDNRTNSPVTNFITPEEAAEADFRELKQRTEKADAETQFKFGMKFWRKEDSGEAEKWFKRAAEQGHAWAADFLGSTYYRGTNYSRQPVERNIAEAIKWYRIAAEKGIAEAQVHLGLIYADGDGVPKDGSEAAKYYRKAANQEHLAELDSVDVARFNLARMYFSGEGVAQDYVEAYKWWNLAAAAGRTEAVRWRNEVASKMTPDQIAEAQRLSRDFKAKGSSYSDSRNPGNSAPVASGTGFFITDGGYLFSNAHVVEGASQIRLVTSTGLIYAKVIKVDSANDLALLKAEGKFSSLPTAPSRGIHLGATVATVGFPNIGMQGFSPKFAKGEIASLSGAGDDARYFQISVPVQPGNSGGALVDERGNVVGVVSAKLNQVAALRASGALPENVNYAVKSSYLLSFLESVPEVSAKLKEPNTKEMKFEDVVRNAEQAAVLVLVY